MYLFGVLCRLSHFAIMIVLGIQLSVFLPYFFHVGKFFDGVVLRTNIMANGCHAWALARDTRPHV